MPCIFDFAFRVRPRVWAPGKSFPGCAFTRSIGDSVAEGIGVTAEPELLRKELTEEDQARISHMYFLNGSPPYYNNKRSPSPQFVVIASDGVWEFLTNQSVADMILKFEDPLEACRAIVAESYRLWLQYEVRTDDITMILAFIDQTGDDSSTCKEPSVTRRRRESRRGSADNITMGVDIVGRAGGENRPVRRGLSKEKRAALTIAASTFGADEDDPRDWDMETVPKTDQELGRIQSAVKANFLFQHLNEVQAQQAPAPASLTPRACMLTR